ncbi:MULTISPECIES: dihydrolipoamide acetyltransferase family protein [Gordonia]|uniref:Dihydrolipoamide acetyltransferase component of pyruvate dehydrogenase complex n=1 Tax=Gordonia amicalis TaxID=89053 RepID=A0AAE4R2Z3_9ACTN|nr:MULTISPECIES: dihydrolipoamide acetyltransferase family protein [Gordonia]ATD71075.1 branched-chain alpha-keto acid dehydrogenase subunit E2 [Gordonia sp. 1D]KAF0969758.1 Dihydrolipoyllysine-residue acetyltransferase component of pyruvate dehydrogenase complex [Gordonia sp. YY1]MCZ0912960.1 dihydrolipoamide acetyltransferase family protein [Gordonia amicalis]MCZ4579571.1 dihydrolipoamide acetyltransferase family protein [Gordonia amicalis]MCZ4653435.1 dihydrolipoamide acetyltransferase fami
MIEFRLPSLGADMDEAKLTEWQIAPGDTVEKGQVVAEVETTKSAIEVETWHDGTVAELKVEVGETIPVGTVMATFYEPGETPSTVKQPARGDAGAPSSTPPPAAPAEPVLVTARTSPSAGPTAPSVPHTTTVAAPTGPMASNRVRISPAARRRARELGLDPDRLRGTGPGGAITLDDVEQHAKTTAPDSRAREMRRTIAAAMSRSKREIPHYYLAETIPMETASRWLSERNAQHPVEERLLPAVLILKAVAVAARKCPSMNGFWTDDEFTMQADVHVGVAIALRGGGLIAPAIHDVPDKSLDTLQSDLVDLVARTRSGKLRSSEFTDSTITVTNLGDNGVEAVFGAIYPPQVALVGVGTMTQRPWIVDGEIKPIPVVTVSLSADHRASDGRQGAKFLSTIRELLLRPHEL